MKYLSIFFLSVLVLFSGPVKAQQRPAQPVIVAPVSLIAFADKIEALGNLKANESVRLTATLTEKVTAINFEDNQRVEKGDILVEMTTKEEQANLNAEQATLEEARRQMERLEPLVKSGAASPAILDERRRAYETAKARLEAIKSRISDRIITAPFSGVVGLRNISLGTVLQPGTLITTLDDDSVMKLDFSVPSVYLSALKPGLEITATSNAYPNLNFQGTVASIDSQIDPQTRSIAVRALIPNNDRLLRPGLLMRIDLYKNPRQTLIVPEEAIVPEGRKSFVYTVENSKAIKKEVTIGTRRPGQVEIIEGLDASMFVIVHGTLNVTDGAQVEVIGEMTDGMSLQEIMRARKAEK